METSKRERIILLGVVPVAAACAGAILTVLGQRYFGTEPPKSDAVMEILKMQGITTADRLKLLEVATKGTDKLYSFLSIALGGLLVPIGAVITSFVRRG